MELLQLKYFCDAAEQENFSKTAKKYQVPVSNISQTIHRLETELGISLFDRYANKVFLNENGKEFFERISVALEKITEATNAIKENSTELSGTISIQICTNRRIVSLAIEIFKKLYPNVIFKINHGTDNSRHYDLVISDETGYKDYNERQHLLSEHICIAMSHQNKLCEKRKISFDDIKSEKFITMPNKSSLYRVTKKICNLNGFEPDIIIQSDDPFYIRKYVEMGLGIAFVPMISWKGQFSDNINIYNIDDITRDTYIFTNEKRYKTKQVRLFINTLLNVCKDENE